MGITANVTNNPITASVTETKVDVSGVGSSAIDVNISGGVGPTGAPGPAGQNATLPDGTEGYVLTYVSGSWTAAAPSGGVTSWNDLEDKPSTFSPSAHAGSHGFYGDDPISIDSTQVITVGNGPTLYWSNFGEMQAAIDAAFAARPTSDSLAAVAFSNSYDDLDDLPSLFSGSYTDLTNKPTLFDGAYTSLTSTPTTLSGYGITDAVSSNDARLTDARTPTAHTHASSDITDFAAAVAAYAPQYAVRSATVSNVSYIGRAVSGSATSASVWTIRRTTVAASGSVTTATATSVAWDNRTTASYS